MKRCIVGGKLRAEHNHISIQESPTRAAIFSHLFGLFWSDNTTTHSSAKAKTKAKARGECKQESVRAESAVQTRCNTHIGPKLKSCCFSHSYPHCFASPHEAERVNWCFVSFLCFHPFVPSRRLSTCWMLVGLCFLAQRRKQAFTTHGVLS